MLRDNRHNRRTDKSIYVKPMQKGGNETFDNVCVVALLYKKIQMKRLGGKSGSLGQS